MNEREAMQHELQVRATQIADLQAEKQRIIGMLNNANANCHRLRDEVHLVTMQTRAIVKALLLRAPGWDHTVITGAQLKDAKFFILDKGDREGLGDNDLSFAIRPMTGEEREKEERMTKQAQAAEKRIIT